MFEISGALFDISKKEGVINIRIRDVSKVFYP